ncbi:MAG: TolC family protein [Bacteroidales bacterium]|nr:TolC family protein [Bacteroidales bacterium]
MLAIAAALVFTLETAAQDEITKVSLTLNQAQEMAVERNFSLANASLDLRAAQANKWNAISAMLPQVNASANYSDNLGYRMQLMGRDIPLPASIDLGITASMSLSGAMVVNAQLRDISMKMADVTLKQTEQDVREQVKSLYFSALITEEMVKLQERNIDNLTKLHEMTQKAVEVGVSEQTSADQLAVQISSMQNNLLSTKWSLEMVYNTLRLQLNLNADTEVELTQTLDDILAVNSYLALLNDEFVLDNNYSFRLAKQSVDLSKKQLSAAGWSCGPTITARYQFTKKNYLTNEETMNMTPPNMVAVALSLPIFSSLNKASSVKAARLAYEKQQNVLSNTEQALQLQHRQLTYNLMTAFESYNTQKSNMEVTQRVFDNISNKYLQGVSSAMDMTNTTTTLINAQSSYFQAVLSLVNAQIELETLLNK